MTDIALESRRMRLRGIVRVASEILSPYWPMRSFVHHNPLHGLEGMRFDQAVRQGELLFGGRGYLPAETYRAYLQSGRIRQSQLDDALHDRATDEPLSVGDRRIGHREVLRTCMIHGIGEDTGAAPDPGELGRTLTLAAWCDRTLGTEIVAVMNEEMVKWCAAFLDEGHATWPMPGRDKGFYSAWRELAGREWRPGGIKGGAKSIRALPELPEDAICESLGQLGVPDEGWEPYLSLELAAMPGWAGFLMWRSEHADHPWQHAYPASLVKYLAVRMWYERELVALACRKHLGIEGNLQAVQAHIKATPPAAETRRPAADLNALIAALNLPNLEPDARATLERWLEAFPPRSRDLIWQRAFEAGYHDALLAKLERPRPTVVAPEGTAELTIRPQSQSIYCLDVRTEPFRRHLESTGDHMTYAYAGFFGAAIRFRPWAKATRTDQVPAVMHPRNEVREIPRSYHEHLVPKHRARARLLNVGYKLLRALKENVVTPYVMVETLGWFYGLPLVSKTLMPGTYRKVADWFREGLLPPIPTSLTVDKLSPADVEAMVAAEQRDAVWKALHDRGLQIDHRNVEAIRLYGLGGRNAPPASEAARALGMKEPELEALVESLHADGLLVDRTTQRRKEKLTRAGYTVEEQAATLENVLRTIGLTSNFARLVLVCAHGSTSANNPYESALDCGACGGNAGSPNSRTVAMMGNNPKVRERLAKVGIEVPADTHFLAGQLDTTTDAVALYDLEDLPPSHRMDVNRLQEDLARASRRCSEERLARLPDVMDNARPDRVWVRGADWSQVRPEWGLSGNAAFIIGPRALTKGLDLGGRVFLNSYDPRQDPQGRLLELVLTGPQLVAQWICMEHYFSTTGNEVYGSGSKAYHNVAGRVGVMTGPSSDLRLGLARQTVMSGDRPYHEPMRLLTVVAATRATLERLIARHLMLQNYYHREWVHLVVWDPDDSRFYRYKPTGGWTEVSLVAPELTLGKEPIA